jgi:hypothetical protein
MEEKRQMGKAKRLLTAKPGDRGSIRRADEGHFCGSMQVPMSPAQIKAKFDVCAAQAIDNSAAEKIYLMLAASRRA